MHFLCIWWFLQDKFFFNFSFYIGVSFSSVQSLSCVWLFATPWTTAHQTSLSITNSWSLFKLRSITSVMPSNHLILCCPLLPPSVFPSIRVFSSESALCIRWPKDWSFSISIVDNKAVLVSGLQWSDSDILILQDKFLKWNYWTKGRRFCEFLRHTANIPAEMYNSDSHQEWVRAVFPPTPSPTELC